MRCNQINITKSKLLDIIKDYGGKIDAIDKIFTKNGYNLSGHAILRVYERSNADVVFDTLKNGEKLLDAQGNLTYFKNNLTVHTDIHTGNIITVVYRGSNPKLPKTWRSYNE